MVATYGVDATKRLFFLLLFNETQIQCIESCYSQCKAGFNLISQRVCKHGFHRGNKGTRRWEADNKIRGDEAERKLGQS